MNTLNQIKPMEFDSIVPVDDLCIAAGLICTSQRRALRHYLLSDGRELTVNTVRNEWALKNPDEFGTASSLADKLGLVENNDFSKAMQSVENIYAEREKIPFAFPSALISRPVWDFTETCHPKNAGIGRLATRLGLSMDTVKLFSLEGSLPKVKGGSERVIAFHTSQEGDNFIAFNGSSYRHIGEPGISVFGVRRKDQTCMVYENPMDFLALMEQCERNGVRAIMDRRYHIILNGTRGIREACDYLKANPDFLEVRCFMPSTESGAQFFAAINDAVKGTAIDRSDLYRGFGSLLRKYVPRAPEAYRKWKAAQVKEEAKAKISEARNVGQNELKPKPEKRPVLGGEKSAVIDRKDGGLKL